MNQAVKVKKVKAFPIAATVKVGTAALQGQVVKLAPQGFLVELAIGHFRPGDKFEITFELPVMHHEITEQCVVMKIYTQWAGNKSSDPASAAKPPEGGASAQGKSQFLIESHFVALNAVNRGKVDAFLRAVRQ
jgi:hypothetical protein